MLCKSQIDFIIVEDENDIFCFNNLNLNNEISQCSFTLLYKTIYTSKERLMHQI